MTDDRPEVLSLLKNLRENLPRLTELLEAAQSEWTYEDGIYRFYHQSFKVYRLQGFTTSMVEALRALAPEVPGAPARELNEWFRQIISEGTGKTFELSHNGRWLTETRPIVEAFFHARFMLEMAVKFGGTETAPAILPSGWAALLYLYGLR